MAKKICTTAGFLSLFDGTAAETASADADATAHTAHLRVNTLQVGPLHHLGLNVRVTDLIADEAALVTEIATICHGRFARELSRPEFSRDLPQKRGQPNESRISITAKFAGSKEKSRFVGWKYANETGR
jgi:hypothetical protein